MAHNKKDYNPYGEYNYNAHIFQMCSKQALANCYSEGDPTSHTKL